MQANLDRDKFIELLGKLGSEDDDEVLGAARDLHAQLTVAGLSWEDLLMPEPSDDEPEPEDDEDEDEDAADDGDWEEPESEEESDEEESDEEESDEEESDEEESDEEESDEEDLDDDDYSDLDEDDDPKISDDEEKEALALIVKILSRSVSAITKEDMEDFKADIKEGEFLPADLRYLRALDNRLK